MGVAEDQFFADAVGHVVQVEAAGVLLDGGVEEDLEQHVSQLLPQVGGVLLVDGLGHLIGLLDEVAADALVGLGPVPGAAAGGPEQGHQLPQVRHGIGVFQGKFCCHTIASFLVRQRMRSSLAILSPLGIRDRSSRETMRSTSTSTP